MGESRGDAAIAEYKKAKDSEKKASTRGAGPIFDFKITNVYLSTNKLVEARKTVTPLVDNYPSFSPAIRALAEIELKDGNGKKARALFEESLGIAPFDLNAWAQLYTACDKLGDKACADDAKSKAEKLYAMRMGNR